MKTNKEIQVIDMFANKVTFYSNPIRTAYVLYSPKGDTFKASEHRSGLIECSALVNARLFHYLSEAKAFVNANPDYDWQIHEVSMSVDIKPIEFAKSGEGN